MFKLNKFTLEKLLDLLKDTCSKESFYWTQRRQLSLGSDDDDFVKSSERDEIIAYILEICEREDMAFNIETFSLCVSLVDRFLCNYKVKSKYLECLGISCLYIACKVKEEDENISVTSEFLQDCDCKCSISELLRMEQMILTKFEWSVNDTTAIDFLNIYYALLVEQYNSDCTKLASQTSDKSSGTINNNFWSPNKDQVRHQPSNTSMIPPPTDLDFMHTLHYKLKHCLCVNELTTTYKPHMLAYSLLCLQMDKTLDTIQDRASLDKMMELIKQNCKISYETLDKCKEAIKYHLVSIENTKSLFDRYFNNEHNLSQRIKDYKPSSLFIPQLSAINTQLTAIKEEDEEEEMLESDDDDDDEETYEQNDYFTRKDCHDKKMANMKYMEQQQLQQQQNMMYTFSNLDMHQTASNLYEMTQEQQQLITYADILMGRKEQKRRLSENSNNSDCEYDYDNMMI